jgi:hypothetical protein
MTEVKGQMAEEVSHLFNWFDWFNSFYLLKRTN